MICGEEIGEFPENFMMHKEDYDYENFEALAERFEDVAAFSPQVYSSCGNLIVGRFSDDRIVVWDIEQFEVRLTIHTNFAYIDPIEISTCGQYFGLR